jgi:hypothetical protein
MVVYAVAFTEAKTGAPLVCPECVRSVPEWFSLEPGADDPAELDREWDWLGQHFKVVRGSKDLSGERPRLEVVPSDDPGPWLVCLVCFDHLRETARREGIEVEIASAKDVERLAERTFGEHSP